MSYYDIDAILTDAQKVPCTIDLTLPSLGYLDSASASNSSSRSSHAHALKAGTRLDLPLWLAEMLAVSSISSTRTLLTLDLPPCLAPRVMNALKADPQSVDLRALAQHFYSLGARILELFEEEEVCDVLMRTWRLRAAEISDHAGNVGAGQRGAGMGGGSGSGGGGGGGGGAGSDGVEFLRGLDEAERGLFRASHDSSKAVRQWMAEIKKG